MKVKDVLKFVYSNENMTVAIINKMLLFCVVYEPLNEVDEIPAHYQFIDSNCNLFLTIDEDDEANVVDGGLLVDDDEKQLSIFFFNTESIELK